jgi:hypothetical protein
MARTSLKASEKKQLKREVSAIDKQRAGLPGDKQRGKPEDRRRWHRIEDKDEAARVMVATLTKLYQDQNGRRDSAARQLSTVLGREIDLTSYADMENGCSEDRVAMTAAVLDTAKAQIASTQRPKPVALTKGASYRMRLEAKKMTKFCEAQLGQPCGRFNNAWGLGEQCLKDAATHGDGLAKVYADEAAGQIVIKRVFAHQFFVHEADARDGNPQFLYHEWDTDRDSAMDRYPEHADAIRTAATSIDSSKLSTTDIGENRLQLYEAWKLPEIVGDKGPLGQGVHMIAVSAGGKGCCLLRETWTVPVFPIARIVWEPNSLGFWSQGMVSGIETLQDDINRFLDYMIENTELGGFGYIDYPKGAYSEDQLRSNKALRLLERLPGFENAGPLNVATPAPFAQTVIDVYQILRSAFFETTGVSDMSTQGRQEQGITAAVAIRTINDLRTQRFLPKSRSYEEFFAQIGRLSVLAAYQLKQQGKSPKLVLHRDGYVDEVDFDAIEMPIEKCEIVVGSMSSTEDTMAGRLSAATDMMTAGWITPEQAKVILTSPNPDIEAFTRRDQAQQRYYEKLISKFQSAEEKTWDALKFPMPDPVLSLELGIAMMTDGYAETKLMGEDDPDSNADFNCRLFTKWITFAWQTLGKGQQPTAPTPPALGVGPSMQTPAAPAEIQGAPPGVPMQ